MISVMRREQYVSFVESFLNGSEATDPFCNRFIAMWIQDRDAEYAQAATWAQPYDRQLSERLRSGEINKDEFQREWLKLWGYSAKDLKFQDMIDAMHSSCYSFDPSGELEWGINEEQLRQELSELLAECRQNTPSLQTA